jgi:putative component of membrane protein insertase Oxa1/YidC/SpoIIIJ protein YidD
MRKWPDGPKPQCGESNRHSVGRLRGYLITTLRGMRLRDWLGTPRTVSLRVVDSYRDGSQREHRCPRAGESCSTLGRAYIARYGAVQGWALAFWVVATCGTASYSEEACDGPGRSGGSCCPG